METNTGAPNSLDSQHLGGSSNSCKENSSEKERDNIVFVNHAEVTWHEMRKQWVGNSSRRSQRTSRDSIMSWTTNYEDLLCSPDPFPQSLSLAELVNLLVDVWQEEGLYD